MVVQECDTNGRYKPVKNHKTKNLFFKYIFVFLLGIFFVLFFTNAFTLIKTNITNAIQVIKRTYFTDDGTLSGNILMDINAGSGNIFINSGYLNFESGNFLGLNDSGFLVFLSGITGGSMRIDGYTPHSLNGSCPAGYSTLIDFYTDMNNNGVNDAGDISFPLNVCDGIQGITGATGATGMNGSGVVMNTIGPVGGCPGGGVNLQFWIDEDNNQTYNAGIDTTSLRSGDICNGTIGATGATGATGLSYSATMNTPPITLTTGSIPVTINMLTPSEVAWTLGTRIRMADQSNPAIFMDGNITAISIPLTSFTIDVDYMSGGGSSVTNRSVSLIGEIGATGANGSPGVTGYTIVSTSSPGAGSCPAGGTTIDFYLDVDYSNNPSPGDISLPSSEICDGIAGLTGIDGHTPQHRWSGPYGSMLEFETSSGVRGPAVDLLGPAGSTGATGFLQAGITGAVPFRNGISWDTTTANIFTTGGDIYITTGYSLTIPNVGHATVVTNSGIQIGQDTNNYYSYIGQEPGGSPVNAMALGYNVGSMGNYLLLDQNNLKPKNPLTITLGDSAYRFGGLYSWHITDDGIAGAGAHVSIGNGSSLAVSGTLYLGNVTSLMPPLSVNYELLGIETISGQIVRYPMSSFLTGYTETDPEFVAHSGDYVSTGFMLNSHALNIPALNLTAGDVGAMPSVVGNYGELLYYNGTQWIALSSGASGQVLMTLGSLAVPTNPVWANIPGGNPGGTSNTLQFNDNGSFSGDTNLVWNNGKLGVGVSGPIAELQVSGNIVFGSPNNTIPNSIYSTVAGGINNTIDATNYGFIGGGNGNDINGNSTSSVIPGGSNNRIASSTNSFAAGQYVNIDHNNVFARNDSTTPFSSFMSNTFLIHAGSGVGINTNHPYTTLDISGDLRIQDVPFTGSLPVLVIDASGFVYQTTGSTLGGETDPEFMAHSGDYIPYGYTLSINNKSLTTAFPGPGILNLSLEDILNYGGVPGVFSTPGDILYYNGTQWTGLGIGTPGWFLKAGVANIPEWAPVTATAGGSPTELQYNDGGSLSGVSVLKYNAGANSFQYTFGQYRYPNNDSQTAFQFRTMAANPNFVVLDIDTQNNRVGINTGTPGYTLDVNGAIHTNSGYYLNSHALNASDVGAITGVIGAGIGDLLYYDGTLGRTNLANGGSISGQFLKSQGGGQIPIWAAGGIGAGTPGGITGSIQFNDNGSFSGMSELVHVSYNRFRYTTGQYWSSSGNSAQAFQFRASNASDVIRDIDTLNNRIGINTLLPLAALDISGTLRIQDVPLTGSLPVLVIDASGFVYQTTGSLGSMGATGYGIGVSPSYNPANPNCGGSGGTDLQFCIDGNNNGVCGNPGDLPTITSWICDGGIGGPVGATGATGADYSDLSSTVTLSLVAGTPATIPVSAGKAWLPGTRVRIYGDPTHYMEGVVSSYSTSNLIVDIDYVVGAGSFTANRAITLAGEIGSAGTPGLTGPTGATGFLQAGITGAVPFWTGGGRDTTTRNIFTTGLNIGISTVLPTAKLDINGTLRVRSITLSGSLTKVLVQDDSGFIYYTTGITGGPGGTGMPGGVSTNIQFNNNGDFSGSNDLIWNNGIMQVVGDFIAGGSTNVIDPVAIGSDNFIGGGRFNIISGNQDFIGGGNDNFIDTNAAGSAIIGSIAGKIYYADAAFILGGWHNLISGSNYSAIIGGMTNQIIDSTGSLAAGQNVSIINDNVFAWNSDPNIVFTSAIANTFLINTLSGVGINTNEPAAALDVSGTFRIRDSQPSGSLTKFLAIDDSGFVYYRNGGSATPAGLTTQIQFNNNGSFSGDSRLVRSGGIMGIGGITGTNAVLQVSGNVMFGDLIYSKIVQGAQYCSILGGEQNQIFGATSLDSVIVGGIGNTIYSGSYKSFIGAGASNGINNAYESVIVGGNGNNIYSGSYQSFIGGGGSNTISSPQSVIVGGVGNEIGTISTRGFIGGGYQNIINSADYSAIVGGIQNKITTGTIHGFIGGGKGNILTGVDYSAIVGGEKNMIEDSSHSFLGGGNSGYLNGDYSFLGGGNGGYLYGNYSFLGGGSNNYLNGNHSFIGGGQNNSLTGGHSIIVGGQSNNINIGANGNSAIIGGSGNRIGTGIDSDGINSVAMGIGARILHNYTFVWNGDKNSLFSSLKDNTFLINSPNGVSINTGWIPDTTPSNTNPLDLNIRQSMRLGPYDVIDGGDSFPFQCDDTTPDVEGSMFFYKHNNNTPPPTNVISYLCYCGRGNAYHVYDNNNLEWRKVSDDSLCSSLTAPE